MVGWCETWGHLMTHVETQHCNEESSNLSKNACVSNRAKTETDLYSDHWCSCKVFLTTYLEAFLGVPTWCLLFFSKIDQWNRSQSRGFQGPLRCVSESFSPRKWQFRAHCKTGLEETTFYEQESKPIKQIYLWNTSEDCTSLPQYFSKYRSNHGKVVDGVLHIKVLVGDFGISMYGLMDIS